MRSAKESSMSTTAGRSASKIRSSGARTPDGNFLELENDSPCTDSGTADTAVEIDYAGGAPDLGAVEFGVSEA
jgi:hypothetical protein